MGGRGGSSGLLTQSSIIDRFKKKIRFDGTEGLDMKAVEKSLKGVYEVLSDFGLPITTINMIVGADAKNAKGTHGLMSVNGFNDLVFDKSTYQSLKKAEEKTKENKGYTISNTLHGNGTHEAGHLVVNEIINRTMGGSTVLQKAKARKNGTVAKQIIKESSKQYGSNPSISKYGGTNPSEKIAEAVSDVYTNKSRANPYSRVIVDIMKKKLKGK